MGLTIVPFALSNITEAVFQAQERMHLIALATVPVYILRLLIMIWAMNLKYGVGYLAGIMVISETLILVIEWILLIQTIKPKWQIKQDFLWDIINSARTLFAIEAIGIIASRMQILMLSLLGSEVLVGIYGGIEQLMQPVYIVVNSILLAAFPRMSKAVDSGREDQRKLTEDMLGILLCIAIPFLMGMLFFGDELLSFAYKDPAFQQAILPLHLVTLTLVTFTFLRTLGYILLANGFENFNLIEVTVTTVLGGLSGVFFISQYKLLGAAYMALVMSFSAAGVLMYAVYSRLFSLRLWKIMHRPSLISLLMLPVFIILKEIGLNFIMTLITATFAYILLVSCLAVYLFGGPFAVWKKLLKKA